MASGRNMARSGLFALVTLLFVAACGTAQAQDVFSDFFGGLFSGGHSRPAPAQTERMRRILPHRENRGPAYWHAPRAKKTAPKEDAAPAKPASEASFFVAVVGDALSHMLANGFDEAFEDRPEIGVLHKGKDSSGLVRNDFYDWLKTARDLAGGGQKIDVAVVMLGSNDRQAISEGGFSFDPFTPRWRDLYGARVDSMLAAFREKNIPVVWVGLPVMKNERFSADMEQLNAIYREHAEKGGAVYVDLWEAFADEGGHYEAFGPDVNGQIVKLRSADGVHFTEAGSRKLAHFVEGEIKRLFEAQQKPESPPAAAQEAPSGGAAPPAQAAAPVVIPSPAGAQPPAAPTLPDRPAIGPQQSLTSPQPADAELARRAQAAPASDPAAAAARALATHVFVEGGDQPARSNRADDFVWKPRAPQPQ